MSISSANKRGRPRVDATPVNVRFPPDQLAALDTVMDRDRELPSRPEFIRRVVEAFSAHALKPQRRLQNFRCIPDGMVVLDISHILSISPHGVYSRVVLLGGSTFDLWEEPDRLAAQLGFHLHLGDSWCHPDMVSAIEQGSGRSIVHLIDGQTIVVPESWEKVSRAVDDARRLHGTPPASASGQPGGAAILARRHAD